MGLFDSIEEWPETVAHPMVFDDSLSFLEKVGRLRLAVNQIIAAYNAFHIKQTEFDGRQDLFDGRLTAFMAFVDTQIATYADEHMLESIQEAITLGNFDTLISALWVPFAASQMDDVNAAMANHTTNHTDSIIVLLNAAQTEHQDMVDDAILALSNATAPTNIVPLLNSCLKGLEGKSYKIIATKATKKYTPAGWTLSNLDHINGIGGDETSSTITVQHSNMQKIVSVLVVPTEGLARHTAVAIPAEHGLTTDIKLITPPAAVGGRLLQLPGGSWSFSSRFCDFGATPEFTLTENPCRLTITHDAIPHNGMVVANRTSDEWSAFSPQLIESLSTTQIVLEWRHNSTGATLNTLEPGIGVSVLRYSPSIERIVNTIPAGEGFWLFMVCDVSEE